MPEKNIQIKNIIYDDGNLGEQWQQVIYAYFHLGYFYYKIENTEKAIQNLKVCVELTKQFDSLDRFTVMHSKLFEGRTFDKQKSGSTFIAAERIKYLSEEKYQFSKDFMETEGIKERLNILR